MTRRIAITGARGQLGRELLVAFAERGDEILEFARPRFDITRQADLAVLAEWRPDAVVNAAAWTDVDGCARDPDRAMAVNGHAAGMVAAAAQRAGGLMVQISTNEVFDGTSDRPYTEDDPTNPINPYGLSKLTGEALTRHHSDRHLIVRTAWIFSRDSGFPVRIRAAADRALAESRPLRVVADEWGNPTPAEWLAPVIARLVELESEGAGRIGVIHAAGQPPATRIEWARDVLADHAVALERIALRDYNRDSRVPPRAILDTGRLGALGIAPGTWALSVP